MAWWQLWLAALAWLCGGMWLGRERPGLGLTCLLAEGVLILLYAVGYFRQQSQRLAYAKGFLTREQLRLERCGRWLNFAGFLSLTALLFLVFAGLCWVMFRALPSVFVFQGTPDFLSALILTANAGLKTEIFFDFFETYKFTLPEKAVPAGMAGSTIVFLFRLAINLTLIRGLLGWWDRRSLILDEIRRLGLASVADEASAALGRLGPSVFPYLRRARRRLDRKKHRTEEEELRRRMICRTLGRLGGEKARRLLLEDAEAARPGPVRLAALRGLALLGDPRDVPLLETARDSGDRESRHVAYRGLLAHPSAEVAERTVDGGVHSLDAEVRDLVVEGLVDQAVAGGSPGVERLLAGPTAEHQAAQVPFLASLEKRDPALADACAARCTGVVQVQHFAKYFPTHLARQAAALGAAPDPAAALDRGIWMGQDALRYVGILALAGYLHSPPPGGTPKEFQGVLDWMRRPTMGNWLGATVTVAKAGGLGALEIGPEAEGNLRRFAEVCARLTEQRNRFVHLRGTATDVTWESVSPLLVEFCQSRWLLQSRPLVCFAPAQKGDSPDTVRVWEYTGSGPPRTHVIPRPGDTPPEGFAVRLPSGRFLSLHPLLVPAVPVGGGFPRVAAYSFLTPGASATAGYCSGDRHWTVRLPRPTQGFADFASLRELGWLRDALEAGDTATR
jgi:multisubunit Na+/H+ antiporter MnhB subunit